MTGWRPARQTGRQLDIVFVACADDVGAFQPAGSAEVGLSRDDRERLCDALEQRRVGSRHGGHRVSAGVWLEIDFDGAPREPLRDPVMRGGRLGASR